MRCVLIHWVQLSSSVITKSSHSFGNIPEKEQKKTSWKYLINKSYHSYSKIYHQHTFDVKIPEFGLHLARFRHKRETILCLSYFWNTDQQCWPEKKNYMTIWRKNKYQKKLISREKNSTYHLDGVMDHIFSGGMRSFIKHGLVQH